VHGLQTGLRQKIQESLIFWLACAPAFALDQATKLWTIRALSPPGRGPAVPVLPPILRFKYMTNTGAAFSIFHEHPEILAVIAGALAAGVLVWGLFFLAPQERLARAALGLIFGGAVGNLADRLARGFVVDFIDIHWQGRTVWPTFNVADSCICVGIGLFLIASWRLGRQEARAAQAPEARASRPTRSPRPERPPRLG
jgi:signal peptidase II